MHVKVETSIIIDKPPEKVADVILDPSKAVLWTSDLENFEVISGKPGQVGSKARLYYFDGGRRYIMEDELLEVEPNRRYLSKVSGDAMEAIVESHLQPIEGGTKVQIYWTGTGNSFLLKVFLPFMRKKIAQQAQQDLIKLKKVVEDSTDNLTGSEV